MLYCYSNYACLLAKGFLQRVQGQRCISSVDLSVRPSVCLSVHHVPVFCPEEYDQAVFSIR